MEKFALKSLASLVGALALTGACGPAPKVGEDGPAVSSGGHAATTGGAAMSGGTAGTGGRTVTGGSPPIVSSGGASSGGAASSCSASADHAYNGAPRVVPGLIEAEDFDPNGYEDTTPGNEGASLRTDVDVDIKELGAGYAIGWMTNGEWLEYTVRVEQAGSYQITLQTGSVDAGRTLDLGACGISLGTVEVPVVPAWGTVGAVNATAELQAGLQVIRVSVGASNDIDFDSMTFTLGGSSPAGGAPGVGGGASDGGAPASGGESSSGGAPGEIPRFVGNITTSNAVDTEGLVFSDYWDQITPENAGKWGSVQGSAGSNPNWGTLDALYDYTAAKGIVFKQHAFVWGTQQPSGSISEANVKDWMHAFCTRYPNTRLIDVVNEPPPHTTPSYVNAIGGGTNGNWQWVTNAFKWAREACPNAILILNDYNNIEWSNDNQHFIDIAKTVMSNGGPIDAVGAQAHDLDNGSVSFQTVERLLNKLHTDTGLPVYITELDLSTTDDQQQLNLYKQYFPFFRDTEFVPGITIWGWIYGRTWSQAPNSGLVRSGQSRSAMQYLMTELGRPAP